MRRYSNTSRITRKKKILECFLSIHKSLGNVLIQNAKKDNLGKRYELLYQKIRANKDQEFSKNKNYLKEKRLNQIFYKNNLYKNKISEETKNMIHKSAFEEKYNELYYLTTSINRDTKRGVNIDSTSYLSDRLKKINKYNPLEDSKANTIYEKNISLKNKNGYNVEIFRLKNNCPNRNVNSYINNLLIKNNYKNSNNNLRKNFFNKINNIKSSLNSKEKTNSRARANAIINNYIKNQNNKKQKKIISRKNDFIYQSFKSKSFAPINIRFRNCNNLKKSAFTMDNLNLFEQNNERIIDKVNYFRVRLNLLSMK